MDDKSNVPGPEGDGSYTRVEVEPMESETRRGYNQAPTQPPFILPRPPVWTTWILLALAWVFLGSSVPFTVLIGLPLNLAALLLAIICMSRGGVVTGVLVLILGTVGSFIVYLTGLFMFLGGVAAAGP